VCPACGTIIRPSQIPLGKKLVCPYCAERLMYDMHHSRDIWASSLLVAMFFTWHFGFRQGMFVLVTMCATVLFALFGLFLMAILIPVPFKRFDPMKESGPIAWFNYDNRYSAAIWAASFVTGIVITFSVGYYKESLIENAMFIFVAACTTLLLGFLGNYVVGRLIPLPPNLAKGESFVSAGSLHLNDKSETDKKANP
jgi:DNA-directed RNA polymerase subunit RPC12/RpoP